MKDGLRSGLATIALCVALSAVLGAATASAQNEDDQDDQDDASDLDDQDDQDDASDLDAEVGGHDDVLFDVHGTLGYYAEVGVGVRIDIPVIDDGLIEGVDDALYVSLGAEALYVYWSTFEGFAVYPLLALQWNFYLDDEWSLFPEIGVALLFGSNRQEWFESFVAPMAGFGVRYRFTGRNALFVRGTWPTGVHLGLTF